MAVRDDLLQLEHDAWRALSTGGETAAEFYDQVLASEVLMLLPGGLVIDDRRAAVDSMRGTPWNEFALSDERVFELDERCVVVAYRATAKRPGQYYEALLNSTYVRENGAWKLALHQQTSL
jgi:hypothetical protein